MKHDHEISAENRPSWVGVGRILQNTEGFSYSVKRIRIEVLED